MSDNMNNHEGENMEDQAIRLRELVRSTQERLQDRDQLFQAAQETSARLFHQLGMKGFEIAYWKEQARVAEHLRQENARLSKLSEELKVVMKMTGTWEHGRRPFGPPNFQP